MKQLAPTYGSARAVLRIVGAVLAAGELPAGELRLQMGVPGPTWSRYLSVITTDFVDSQGPVIAVVKRGRRTFLVARSIGRQSQQWTAEDDRTLALMWEPGGSQVELAHTLQRSVHAVRQRACSLGLSATPRKSWTPADEAYLRDAYHSSTLNDLAEHLGRSPKAIYARACKLNITTPRRPRVASPSDAEFLAAVKRISREEGTASTKLLTETFGYASPGAVTRRVRRLVSEGYLTVTKQASRAHSQEFQLTKLGLVATSR